MSPDGGKAGLLRIALVLAAYFVAAFLLVLPLASFLRRALVLPESFDTLVGWGLVVGGAAAALFAWHYPRLGWHGGAAPEDEASGE